jgi:hypothetical protein
MDEQETRTSTRGHLNRRAVVRAGVWTVPAVTLATAAPAFAAASVQTAPTPQLNFLNIYGADYSGSKAGSAESQTSVQNVWQNASPTGGPTLTQIMLVVDYQNKNDGDAPTSSPAPGGRSPR